MKAKIVLYNKEDDKIITRLFDWSEEVRIFDKVKNEIDHSFASDLSVFDNQIIIDGKYFDIVNMLSKNKFEDEE